MTDDTTVTTAEIDRRERTVEVGKLVAAPWNARRTMDDGAIRELAASIEAEGLLQPLVVRGLPTVGDGFEVICGARRLAALRILQRDRVRVLVVTANDATAHMMNLAENIQRASLLPLEEAQAFGRLVDVDGMTVLQIAERVGKARDVSYVYQRLRLLKLIPKFSAALKAGTIGLGVALQAARLPEETQKDLAGVMLGPSYGNGVEYGVRWVKEWVRHHAMHDLKRAVWLMDQADLPGGACMVCPKRTGGVPELFPDLRKGKATVDLCLDRTCWTKRTKTVIEIARKNDPALVELKGYDEGARFKVVIDGAERGVIVEEGFNEDARAVGSIVSFERMGKQADAAASSASEIARKREAKKRREAEAVRMELYRWIVGKLGGNSSQFDWDWGVKTLIGRIVNDDRRYFCKVMGIEAAKSASGGRDFKGAMWRWCQETHPLNFRTFLILAAIVAGSQYHAGGANDPLVEVGKRLGYSLKDCAAEMARRATKTAAKTKTAVKKRIAKKG